MANLNDALPSRWKHGGKMLIGADEVLQIVDGSIRRKRPSHEKHQQFDRGKLGVVLPGQERPCGFELDLKATSALDYLAIMALMRGALVSNKISPVTATGEVFSFTATLKFFDGEGLITGLQEVYTGCYLEEDVDYEPGDAFDVYKIKIMTNTLSPTITSF